MQVLLVSDIVKDLYFGVVSLVSIGKLLVPPLVGDNETHSKTEDDEDLADSRDHTHDDTSLVLWCLYNVGQRGIDNTVQGDLPEAMKAYGPTMLPTATPMKMAADDRVFLVVPPTLPATRDRASTNTAFDDPVKSTRCQFGQDELGEDTHSNR